MLEGTNRIDELCTFSLSHAGTEWIATGVVASQVCPATRSMIWAKVKKQNNTKKSLFSPYLNVLTLLFCKHLCGNNSSLIQYQLSVYACMYLFLSHFTLT